MGPGSISDIAQPAYRRALLAIFVVAVLLRLLAALPFRTEHPDEIWQYLEPAYHLVRGPWVETWEQRDGMRSWLLPGLIAGPMWLGKALAPSGTLYLLLPRLCLAAVSLLIVGAAVRIGATLTRAHALAAGAVAAVWFEIVYMAPRVLTESVSTAATLMAAALLMKPLAPSERGSDLLAGALLGLGLVLRIQHAPAIAVLALAVLDRGGGWRRLPALAAGALVALALDAGVALAVGQVPFAWIAKNVVFNVVEGRSKLFGIAPPWEYLVFVGKRWSGAAVPILVLAGFGARRCPALAAAAVTDLVVHSAIAHKEWRFIFLALAIAVILAALGSVELWQRTGPERRRVVGGLLALFWTAATLLLPRPQPFAFTQGPELAAVRFAAAIDRSCTIGLYKFPHLALAAHALSDAPMDFAVYDDPATADGDLARDSRALGSVIYFENKPAPAENGFAERRCFTDRKLPPFCVVRRSAPCTASVPLENRVASQMKKAGT